MLKMLSHTYYVQGYQVLYIIQEIFAVKNFRTRQGVRKLNT